MRQLTNIQNELKRSRIAKGATLQLIGDYMVRGHARPTGPQLSRSAGPGRERGWSIGEGQQSFGSEKG